MTLVGACDSGPCLAVLLGRLGEDRRAILGADVAALAIELGRVMRREIDVEQVAKGQLGGVEHDLDRLGVAGIPAAHRLVGRLGGLPAGVAAFDRLDPEQVEENRLGAPETATGQDRGFVGHHFVLSVCWTGCRKHNQVRKANGVRAVAVSYTSSPSLRLSQPTTR